VLLVGLVALAGCGHDDPPWTHLSWQPATLPVPDDTRVLVRAATWCGDRWVVVGATADARSDTQPAVWTSADGRRWSTVRLHPGRDYYAAREVLGSVGCRDGRAAVLGAKPGGAHGIPRTATWQQRPDGSLAVVRAPYVRYGGTSNVAVSRLEGGPKGYLIAGTRTSGAAVWTSRTGAAFRLHEDVPGLANTRSTRTQAIDAVPAGGRWVVAGNPTEDNGRVRATAWLGTDGKWSGQLLPGGTTISTAERATTTGAGAAVAGLLDQRFGLWLRHGVGWSLGGSFGERDAEATSAAYVSGLAWTGSLIAATYSDGSQFGLAVGEVGGPDDGPLPEKVTVRGDHTATVATHGPALLLLTDDGNDGRVWLTHVPGPTS
jgi:hypothetical protein